MIKYSNEELKAIKNSLKAGKVYTGIKNNISCGCIELIEGNKIKYTMYGSSCIKNTIKELKWLLNDIFGECDLITECIYSEYHMNYKALDNKYNCIDMSKVHPNVYGL